MESEAGATSQDIPSKVKNFITSWHTWEHDITVIPRWFNIQIEVNYEPKKWGFAGVLICDGSYRKGAKLITGGLLGPLGLGLELRYKMGMK